MTNVAKVYEKQGDFEEALAIYEELLNSEASDVQYARMLTNYAVIQWEIDPTSDVHGDLLAALAIRLDANDHLGVVSSYYHLARFHKATRPDSALFYAQQMLDHAARIRNTPDQLLALRLLVQLSHEPESKT